MSKLNDQRKLALKNPYSELTQDVFSSFGMHNKKFIRNRIVYRFLENFQRGEKGEYIGYNGYIMFVQGGLDPIATAVCELTSIAEFRAIYKIITKTSIDDYKKLMKIKEDIQD